MSEPCRSWGRIGIVLLLESICILLLAHVMHNIIFLKTMHNRGERLYSTVQYSTVLYCVKC